VLFKRNLDGDVASLVALCRSIHEALPAPLLGVDQEGGRVVRLRAPFLQLPPMRALGEVADEAQVERIAAVVAQELGAAGFTVNFAPVLDVDTRPDSPVIGDRSFSSDAAVCARLGAAFIRGHQQGGVLAVGKHFPGHGDTRADSHVDLPVVELSLERLDQVELAPFRAAARSGVAALMSAHVIYTAIDAARPGTLSPEIGTALLRGRLGFRGLLVSDDLFMRAIADRQPVADAAVEAVRAGCDALLLCEPGDAQDAALEALVREADRSPAFASRCAEAHERVMAARARARAGVPEIHRARALVGGEASRRVAAELARALSARGARQA
jgi:beta-N-acetylhexosaminidase